MSGYNVTTPRLFRVNDPADLVQFNLNTLNATFTQPDKQSNRTLDGSPYTADELLGGYIYQNNPCCYDNTFDSASNIISTLYVKSFGITNNDNIQNGFTFSCILFNAGGDFLLSQTGAEGVFCNETIVLEDSAVKLQVVVVDQSRLGETHSDQVAIIISGGVNPEVYFCNPCDLNPGLIDPNAPRATNSRSEKRALFAAKRKDGKPCSMC